MTRSRQPAKDEVVEVFVVKNTESNGDAITVVLCEECGGTFFTSPGNRSVAIERGMRILCFSCTPKVARREGHEISIAGRINKGKIIQFGM